jgi:hypothetical protein
MMHCGSLNVVTPFVGREEKCVQPLGGEMKERDYLKNLGVEERKMLKSISA